MELREFISKSLGEIYGGIQDANNDLPRDREGNGMYYLAVGYGSTGVPTGIEFDVAVTVSSAGKTGGGAGVQIAVVKASLGTEESRSHEEASRIKFKILAHDIPTSRGDAFRGRSRTNDFDSER